jgi:hypothetical protein
MPYCKEYSMIKGHFLKAPETQIGVHTMATIQEWDDSPTALQILKTIDWAIHGSDCTNFVIMTLEVYLDNAIEAEQTTYEDVVKLATWRKMR